MLLLLAITTLVVALVTRAVFIIPYFNLGTSMRRKGDKTKLIFLGSGGHTGEMIRLVTNNPQLQGNVIVGYSRGDANSLAKFAKSVPNVHIMQSFALPRARKVHQSWATTPVSSFVSVFGTLQSLYGVECPDLVVVNGPGTCVILVACIKILQLFGGWRRARIVYIESLTRVSGLSISGKLLYYLVDSFVVQWPELKKAYPRAHCFGMLV